MSGREVRVRVLVSGLVQGVWFRAATQQQARAQGVRGWVRNLDDGRVEAVFEGPEGAVDELVAFVRVGPEPARVDRIERVDERPRGEDEGFEIVR